MGVDISLQLGLRCRFLSRPDRARSNCRIYAKTQLSLPDCFETSLILENQDYVTGLGTDMPAKPPADKGYETWIAPFTILGPHHQDAFSVPAADDKAELDCPGDYRKPVGVR